MTDYDPTKVSRTDCTPWRDEETVRYYYVQRADSIGSLSRRFGCSRACMSKWIDKHGFEKRSVSKQKRLDMAPDELRDADFLRREYVNNEKSMGAIAEQLSCSRGAVARWLKRHGIETRDLTTAQRLRGGELLNDEDELRRLYSDEGMAAREIAEQSESSTKAVLRRLHAYDIQVRETSYSGEDHHWYRGVERWPDWRGENWDEQAEARREMDGHECQVCGTESEGRKLDVHHIIPFREFDDYKEANRLENLITLCPSCHQSIEAFAPLLPSR